MPGMDLTGASGEEIKKSADVVFKYYDAWQKNTRDTSKLEQFKTVYRTFRQTYSKATSEKFLPGAEGMGKALEPQSPEISDVSPKDFTPESVAKFQQSGNYGDLERVETPKEY